MSIQRLKRRAEFLAVGGQGLRCVTPGVVLQALDRSQGPTARRFTDAAPDSKPTPGIRYGITASKRVGNAVARNRVRRRLRALAEALLPVYGVPGCDYVLVGRAVTVSRAHEALTGDLTNALVRVRSMPRRTRDAQSAGRQPTTGQR